MTEFQLKTLERRLAELPQEVMPPRNLWPEIVARIGRTQRQTHPYALAASVAVCAACVASIFTWAAMRHSHTALGLPVVAKGAPFDEPGDPRFILARDELRKTFDERMAMLEPKTRAQIEASLMVIRDAHEKIRKALQADPASPALEQLWQSSMRDEIDLYDRVVRTTEPNMTRT
jgi:uncharacterized NAD(P)/FAD-binding protein YdhS